MNELNMDTIRYIRNRVKRAALLELLAEEGAELTKAALKMARIYRKENPTPVKKGKAYRNLIEEFSDVILCASVLRITFDDDIVGRKTMRWIKRLKEKEQEEKRRCESKRLKRQQEPAERLRKKKHSRNI